MIKHKVYVDDEGTIIWYNEKWELHRLDGPAVEDFDGTKEWYKEGKLHRLDGPAIEGGHGLELWYIKGKRFTEEEFNKKIKIT